uniref:apolipoprotein A-I-like n=1 Tax=Podarcis muralis TaxID=64176 RepID=UPI0010A0B556|nr:apolipoprotein A-I-like [Podarcis muralis]
MKFFVLTLALVILTGTWASVLGDEPNSRLDKLMEQLKEDWENITGTVQEKLGLIENSEVTKELTNLIKSAYWGNIGMRLYALHEELPAEVVQSLEMFIEVPSVVSEKAVRYLFALQSYRGRYQEELGEALHSALVGYVDPVLEKVGPYAAILHSAVVSRMQEITLKMDEKILQQMEILKTQLEPHIKEFQESQASLQSYLDDAYELIRKGAETIHKHLLKPYFAPILKLYNKYKNDIREWDPEFYQMP